MIRKAAFALLLGTFVAACHSQASEDQRLWELAVSDGAAGNCIYRETGLRMTATSLRDSLRLPYNIAPIPAGFEELERNPRPDERAYPLSGDKIGGRQIVQGKEKSCVTLDRPVILGNRAVVSIVFGTRINRWMIRRHGQWSIAKDTIDQGAI